MNQNILDFLQKTALTALENNSSLENWAASIGEVLYYPQQEIIQTICDPKNRNITLLASRSAGKSYGVCLAMIKLCLDNPGYEILVFAPKSTQSERLLGVIRKIAKKPNNKILNKEINWLSTNVSRITFKNGSLITALSGDESTQVEGYHGDLIVMDECHQIADSVFNLRISPMIKSSANPKILKLGISLYKNNFYQSCHDDQWVHLVYPWNVCKNIFKAGVTVVDGVEYPNSVLDDMPLSYKLARFPDNPELHFASKAKLSEEDFDTQYEMKWIDTLNKYLTDKELGMMVGTHDSLDAGKAEEEYYFGIDFAGGALIQNTKETDYTQLSIIRKFADGTKELVYVAEWQGDVVSQLDEINNLISPIYGQFKCKFGTADYSTLGIGMVDILVKNYKLPLAGIQLKRTEPVSGRPYKIALFDNWRAELQQGYFKYPNYECIENNDLLKKHFYEWESLEKRITRNKNIQISAPLHSNIHDDCPISVIMACWAADRMQEELRNMPFNKKANSMQPPIIFSGSTTLARNGKSAQASFFDRFVKVRF